MPDSRRKIALLAMITAACVTVAAGYTIFTARRNAAPVTTAPIVDAPARAPVLSPEAPVAVRSPSDTAPRAEPPPEHAAPQPYLVALNMRDSPERGSVEVMQLDSLDRRRSTNLRCERVYFAAGVGICLAREIRFFSAQTVATIVDAELQPVFSVRTDGIPSRARVSPDGRYAAFTVFVAGHTYADAELSTATLLIDVAARQAIANLEEFEVLQNGAPMKAADFNYWGVTFDRDANFFYATLRTGGVNYLVRGEILAKRVTVVSSGVECPSLAPDGTRIGFKKLFAPGQWRIAVLDLATSKETILAETRSVDDQVEWLDNHAILYGLVDPAPWMNIMIVAADGSGQPRVFATGAASPAVVRLPASPAAVRPLKSAPTMNSRTSTP